MSLVFASIAPHPPILIPQIGKENLSRLKATQKALANLSKKLLEKNIETLIIISPHGLVQQDAFTMNLSPEYNCNFEDFGDFSTNKNYAGNIGLAHKIRESLETKISLQLTSEARLDHGVGVPLYLLTEKLSDIKIIPIYFSGLDNKAHYEFGKLLKKEIQKNESRIGIIASGDLSHRLTESAPAGYSPRGKKFDQKLISLLQKKKPKDIINLDEDLVMEAGECGLKSFLILLGILDNINYQPQLLSYEGPFGVGYLVMDFEL